MSSVQAWKSAAGILAAIITVAPDFLDGFADDVTGTTGNLFDEYGAVRQLARAAIVSVAEDGRRDCHETPGADPYRKYNRQRLATHAERLRR